MINPEIDAIRTDIPFLSQGIYVDNASVSPMSNRVQKASQQFDRLISEQLRTHKAPALAVYDRGRALAGKLVNMPTSSVAYIQNTSHGLSLVALGLDWREGDNLVLCDQEFPSNYLCWAQVEQRGVEVRRISPADGRLEVEQFRAAMDSRTRAIAVSHVQFCSGFRVDLAALGDVCRQNGALLVVDGTQSIGAIRLDASASGVDVVAVSAHKWLMGPRGIGFAAFSDRALAQVTPRIVGWLSVENPFEFRRTLDFLPDARRFESGTPNGAGIFGLAERLTEIDELGMDWIESRILDLGDHLCTAARRQGLHVVYPFKRKFRSGINMLAKPSESVASVHDRLNANNVFASIRNGAIRVAPHYFCTYEEMEQIARVMAGESRGTCRS